MIFLDANPPVYLHGADKRHKGDTQVHLRWLAVEGERIVTDAEVLREIPHRDTAIRRPQAIFPCLRWLLAKADEIFAVETPDVLRAAEIVHSGAGFPAQDAPRIAVMQRPRVSRILSFDADFDRWPGLTRLGAIAP